MRVRRGDDRGSNTVEYAMLSAVIAAMMVGLLAFGETAGVFLSGLTDSVSHGLPAKADPPAVAPAP